jgi:signal transduction histidine kinase
MLLIVVAGLMVGATVAVLAAAWSVNHLKNMLVEEARDEARAAANVACEQIRRSLMQEHGSTLAEIIHLPTVSRQLSMLSEQQEIVMACVLDDEGQILFHYSAGKGEVWYEPERRDEPEGVPGAKADEEPYIPVAMPIMRDGRLMGQVHVGYSRTRATSRIDRLSRDITISLTVISITVLAVLLVTGLLLTRVFRRHEQMTHRATNSEYLANLGALASGLAHEIRNPLYAMNLHLEVVREDLEDDKAPPDNGQLTQSIGIVQKQIEHLNGIVSNFVKLSLPTRLQQREMDLAQQLRESLCFLSLELKAHKIQYEIDVPEKMPLTGDNQALHQVLLNILINARQAMEKSPEDGRRIRMSAHALRKGKGWEVFIDDSGPGIPDEHEESIFRGFTAKRAGGMGFGLSLARHIMEAHGGTIHASKSPLGGARIVLRFPQQEKARSGEPQ